MTCPKCGNNDRGDNNVDALRHELDAWRVLGFALCGPPITCDQDMRDGINEQIVSLARNLATALARAEAAERDRDDYREGAAAEARRCDELLAERNRARNETIAALERVEAAVLENRAWRALFWHSYESGLPLDCHNYQERLCVAVTSSIEQETWRGIGSAPQAAAIDLATKLNLLNPESGAKGEGGGEG